jgi:pimeloyl-ACP methyl ester carboxylesterase
MTSTHFLNRAEYPFTSHYFNINGQHLHYIDEGKGKTLLFVHGTPSWSFDFRYQIKALSKKYRCIALDHIGFGLSDKPKIYDYSTQNHALTLEKLIHYLGLQDITLLVHDFGGIIGFDYALKNPENISKIVVLNSWLWSAESEPEYQKIKPILRSPLLPFLYRHMNFSVQFILPNSFYNKKILSKEIKKQYTKPFANSSERNGTIAFAKSLLYDQSYFESLWQQVHALADKEVLFIWGMNDGVILPKYLEKFALSFPKKYVVQLQACGHFPQEEKKVEVLEAIEQFLKN